MPALRVQIPQVAENHNSLLSGTLNKYLRRKDNTVTLAQSEIQRVQEKLTGYVTGGMTTGKKHARDALTGLENSMKLDQADATNLGAQLNQAMSQIDADVRNNSNVAADLRSEVNNFEK